ncbi:MAG: hypothetical protein V5B40_09255 [Candidatus Accumulibacter meliphilus]|jgi:hypothetical protein
MLTPITGELRWRQRAHIHIVFGHAVIASQEESFSRPAIPL